MLTEFLNWFDTTEKVAILISAISAFIASISTISAIFANRMNHQQYCKSIEPQLSMDLVNFNNMLYLQIKNTGKTPAKDICIILQTLISNGDKKFEINKNGLFGINFELYPEEQVRTEVAYCYDTLDCKTFPQIALKVSYKQEGKKKAVSYKRTVTFAPAYNSKILADVNLDTHKIESSLRHISRASVRTANYLDGHQIAEFDELDILSGKSLENDLRKALEKNEEHIYSREETINNRIIK